MTTLKILTCLVLVLVSEAGVHGRAPNVLVVASSKHNHTFQLGTAIAEGAAAAGLQARKETQLRGTPQQASKGT